MIGDLALGRLDDNLRDHVAQLRGRKVLVPGNHDRCWAGHKKHDPSSRGDYYRIGGFAEIIDSPKPLQIGRHKVRVNHFPYLVDERYDLKFKEHRPRDDGKWLIHGHINETWRQRGRQINVGVDIRAGRRSHRAPAASVLAVAVLALRGCPDCCRDL